MTIHNNFYAGMAVFSLFLFVLVLITLRLRTLRNKDIYRNLEELQFIVMNTDSLEDKDQIMKIVNNIDYLRRFEIRFLSLPLLISSCILFTAMALTFYDSPFLVLDFILGAFFVIGTQIIIFAAIRFSEEIMKLDELLLVIKKPYVYEFMLTPYKSMSIKK